MIAVVPNKIQLLYPSEHDHEYEKRAHHLLHVQYHTVPKDTVACFGELLWYE